MAFPTLPGSPTILTYVPDDLALADGTNVTGTYNPNQGPAIPLTPVPGAIAGSCVYRANALDGHAALEYNGVATGGLTSGPSALFQPLVSHAAGGGADQSWCFGMRVRCDLVTLTNHIASFSSNIDMFGAGSSTNQFATLGPQFTNPNSNWQARRRDDNTNTGGGAGVQVLGATTGVHTFVAHFDGTIMRVRVDGVEVQQVSAPTAQSFTCNILTLGAIYRPAAATPVTNVFDGLQGNTFLVSPSPALGDVPSLETWLATAPVGAAVGTATATSSAVGIAAGVGPVAGVTGTDVIVVAGSSTAEGFGLTSQATERYSALLAADLPASVQNIAQQGRSSWELLPTGTVNPPWAEVPNAARNTNAMLALNPRVVIVDVMSDFNLFDSTYVPAGYTGTWDQYALLFLANLQTIYNTIVATGARCIITAAQPYDTTVTQPYIWRRHLMRVLCAEAFGVDYWDKFPSMLALDGSARPGILQADGSHPTAAQHAVFARELRGMLAGFPTSQRAGQAPAAFLTRGVGDTAATSSAAGVGAAVGSAVATSSAVGVEHVAASPGTAVATSSAVGVSAAVGSALATSSATAVYTPRVPAGVAIAISTAFAQPVFFGVATATSAATAYGLVNLPTTPTLYPHAARTALAIR